MRRTKASGPFRAVAGAALVLLPAAAFAAKPTVTTGLSDVGLDRSALQAGQTLQVTYTVSGATSDQGVKIEFVKDGTVAKTQTFAAGTPETTPGTHSALVDTSGLPNGSYTVRVSAPAGVLASYARVSDSSPQIHFSNPRGVDVNNITGSPAFGRIYVTEGQGATTGGRTTVEGLYMLNPDLTEVAGSPKATNADLEAAGVDDWGATNNSPFRVVLGPDGHAYITDWSDPHSGIFETDADGNNFAPVLFFPNGDHGNGLVMNNNDGSPMYGSNSSIWVEGTGADRTFYTADEDLTPGNSIWKYAVPDGETSANVSPTLAVDMTGKSSTSYEDVVRDSDGNFYVVANATNQAFKLDPTGALIAKLPDTGDGYTGIAIDNAKNVIAISSNAGRVYLTDKSFATVKSTIKITNSTGNRDVALDADDWIYVVNSFDELLYVFAAPGTSVPGAQASAATALSVLSPVPGDISPVGPTGLFTGPNGGRYGDGKVTVQDAVDVLRVAAGLQQLP